MACPRRRKTESYWDRRDVLRWTKAQIWLNPETADVDVDVDVVVVVVAAVFFLFFISCDVFSVFSFLNGIPKRKNLSHMKTG